MLYLKLKLRMVFHKRKIAMYSQFMLVWKMWICSIRIDMLEKKLSITEYSLVYVPFHSEKTLDECRNLNLDEPSFIGVHKMHTHAPQIRCLI